MFNSLSNKITGVLGKLRGRGVLTEADIDAALREVRIAMLGADVALSVVKNFTASLKEKALGAEVVKSISPAQMVIKLVQDHLTELLGSEYAELNLAATPPGCYSYGGLARLRQNHQHRQAGVAPEKPPEQKILLASLDVYRPAAQKQLEVLAQQTQTGSLPVVEGEKPCWKSQNALWPQAKPKAMT